MSSSKIIRQWPSSVEIVWLNKISFKLINRLTKTTQVKTEDCKKTSSELPNV